MTSAISSSLTMHKVAQAITAFVAIVGFVAMVLLFVALGLANEHGTGIKSNMAKDIAFVIGISKFQLGVYSAITMLVSFLVAGLLSKKCTSPKRRVPSGLGERKY